MDAAADVVVGDSPPVDIVITVPLGVVTATAAIVGGMSAAAPRELSVVLEAAFWLGKSTE